MLFNKLNYFRVTHQVLCLSDNYNGNALNNIDCICGKKVSSPKPKKLGLLIYLILCIIVRYCFHVLKKRLIISLQLK